MAKERDYVHERKLAQARGETIISTKIKGKLAADFSAKCEANNTTKNAVLKRYVERYTYEDFDQ